MPNRDALYGIYDDVTSPYTDFDYNRIGITEADLREAYEVGFVADNVSSYDRAVARDDFLDYMAELGFLEDGFDWDAWREAWGYTG